MKSLNEMNLDELLNEYFYDYDKMQNPNQRTTVMNLAAFRIKMIYKIEEKDYKKNFPEYFL